MQQQTFIHLKHSFHSFYSFLWRKGWFGEFDFWSFLATKQYFAFRNDHFQYRENCKLLELTASLIHLHFQISDFPRGSTSDFSWLVECFKFWSYRMFLVLWDAKKEKMKRGILIKTEHLLAGQQFLQINQNSRNIFHPLKPLIHH